MLVDRYRVRFSRVPLGLDCEARSGRPLDPQLNAHDWTWLPSLPPYLLISCGLLADLID